MVIILIGVAGSGKTTVGRLLSEKLGWRFYDADDFHPNANIEKMSRGIPLTDEDRWPWLESIRNFIDDTDDEMVFACSALKKSYRDFLRLSTKRLEFIYLKGSKEVILERLEQREGHYAGADLLDSQFKDLEEPQNVPVEDLTKDPESIASDIIKMLKI